MTLRTLRAGAVAALVASLAVACGGSSPPPPPRHTPTAAPTPLPTPGPDRETLTVLGAGVGTFDLVAIPVVLLHNDASRHGAEGVVVHFATSRNGTPLASVDSAPVNLAPGETLPVTADCTEACLNATGVSPSTTIGAWVNRPGPSFTGGAATYACSGCGGGHAHGDVNGSISIAQLPAATPAVVFADCKAADGSIVGGGSRQLVWPGGPSSSVDVAVLVDAPPAGCELGASTGW